MRCGPLNEPFPGMNVDGLTWVLSTVAFGAVSDAVEWFSGASSGPTARAAGIRYWGHYPVLNMEYQTDASVGVALRASPLFIPGDVTASCMPAAVFGAHLRNLNAQRKDGVVAFSPPGPSESERGSLHAERAPLQQDGRRGTVARGELASCVLALLGSPLGRTGGALGWDAGARGRIDHCLTSATGTTGSSLSAPFPLDAGEQGVLRFLLSWHSARWFACGHPDPQGGGDYYQDLILWSPPAACDGTAVAGPFGSGGRARRVLAAGHTEETEAAAASTGDRAA